MKNPPTQKRGFIPFKMGGKIIDHPSKLTAAHHAQFASRTSSKINRLTRRHPPRGLGDRLHHFLKPLVSIFDQLFRTKMSQCDACRRRATKLNRFGWKLQAIWQRSIVAATTLKLRCNALLEMVFPP